MKRMMPALLLLAVAWPAAAQPEPEWRQAREEQVRVRLGGFEPDPLVLRAGHPTRLVFYNSSRARMSVSAPDFFARARIRSGDADQIRGGSFLLAPGETLAISLVPAAGNYRFGSGSWFRRLLGMSSRIVVQPPEQQSEGRSLD